MEIRKEWLNNLQKIINPILTLLSQNLLKKKFIIDFSSNNKVKNKAVAYLQAFARILVGITNWLSLSDSQIDTNESKIKNHYLNLVVLCLKNGFNQDSPDYLFSNHAQNLVELAFIAQSFIKSKKIWNLLDNTTKNNIINLFYISRKFIPHNNNWILFTAIIETFLLDIGKNSIHEKITYALNTCEKWYVGDGWYSDGNDFKMDFYNSFIFHSFIIDIIPVLDRLQCNKSKINYNTCLHRMQRYSEFLERLVSVDGSFPPFGRSIVYRFACFHTLSHCVLLNKLPNTLSYGQVKACLTQVMRNFFTNNQNFNEYNFLVIGFNGFQPDIGDEYIDSGSLYYTTVGFLPLGLPPNNIFWTSKCQDWTQKKAWSGNNVSNDKALLR